MTSLWGDTFGIMMAVFLVLLNGFFVAAEFALVKVRKSQLNEMVKRGEIKQIAVVQEIEKSTHSPQNNLNPNGSGMRNIAVFGFQFGGQLDILFGALQGVASPVGDRDRDPEFRAQVAGELLQ